VKIIQVFNKYLLRGGEEKSAQRIAEDLREGGHEVFQYWRASAEWNGAGGPSKLRQLFLGWRNTEALNKLEALQREQRADLWILHNIIPVVSFGVYSLSARLGTPIFQWLHNYRPISPSGGLMAGQRVLEPEDRWIHLKETLAGSWRGRIPTAWLALCYARLKSRRDFSSVRAWIPVSEAMRHIFLRAGWDPKKTHALRHSWHLDPSRQPAADAGHFLFMGRMTATKGIDFLVRLWGDPRFRDVPLIMAGEGELKAKLEKASPPAVRWVGHVEGAEKEKWLASCRAVLFPSLWPEPLSTIAYEAYEHGKPILASSNGGMPEIILDGKTGYLLPPGEEAPWKKTLLSLMENPPLASTLGRQGRHWLETNATPQSWNQRFNEIVSLTLGRR
jgi:glycosyltransferase involved in cell wall biosynthesis